MRRFTLDESNRGEIAKMDLSKKARWVINNTDPCGIFEVVNGNEKRYYITGVYELEGTLEEIEKELECIYEDDHRMQIQFEAGDGVNILWGKDADVEIIAEIEIVPGCSDDFGYLTMKRAIISKFPDKKFDFWYDGQESFLCDDADVDCKVAITIKEV